MQNRLNVKVARAFLCWCQIFHAVICLCALINKSVYLVSMITIWLSIDVVQQITKNCNEIHQSFYLNSSTFFGSHPVESVLRSYCVKMKKKMKTKIRHQQTKVCAICKTNWKYQKFYIFECINRKILFFISI